MAIIGTQDARSSEATGPADTVLDIEHLPSVRER
jgi:hypothetical protein